jgi:hypothetical protein
MNGILFFFSGRTRENVLAVITIIAIIIRVISVIVGE